MNHFTGEFETVPLSERAIIRPRSEAVSTRAPRRILTDEIRPLPFELRFSNGEVLEVLLYGSGSEPTSLWRIIDRLKELANLRHGWDSYDAAPLNPVAVRRTLQLLPKLLESGAPDPAVVPTCDGGVQLEWHDHTGDVEIRVSPTGPIAYLTSDAATDLENEWEGPLDIDPIRAAFARMLPRT